LTERRTIEEGAESAAQRLRIGAARDSTPIRQATNAIRKGMILLNRDAAIGDEREPRAR
jgi:hypothetical protein